MRLSMLALAAALCAGASGQALAASPDCDSRAARAEVERTVRAWFAAAAKDDEAGARRLTSADFQAFDMGRRFEGEGLFQAVREAHAKGVVLEWNLSRFEVRAGCDLAWAAWENHGRVGSAVALQPMDWQESAGLRRTPAGWVIEFLHSNRVESAKVAGR